MNLGFLTVLHEANGYVGGYLVTNLWGRPLEFRVSTAVQPNRVQKILYGQTLEPYLCTDLIGKALVEKTAAAAQLIFTDKAPVLDLRLRLEVPVAWLAADDERGTGLKPVLPFLEVQREKEETPRVLCHPRLAGDVSLIQKALAQLDAGFDLNEPFDRIREAVAEARKMGVTQRAA